MQLLATNRRKSAQANEFPVSGLAYPVSSVSKAFLPASGDFRVLSAPVTLITSLQHALNRKDASNNSMSAHKPINYSHCVLALIFLVGVSLLPAAAQQSSTAPPQTPPQTPSSPPPTQQPATPQRPLGVLPQFGVTYQHDAPPLRPIQKFRVWWRTSIDPATITIAGIEAGVGQAENSFSGYGQGAQGYGKRFGASLADEASSGFFSNFFYSTIFKEDPRYFRVGEGTVKHRFWRSIIQEFVCHTDAGGRSFSYENVLGAFSSGALSNAYYPDSDRGFGLTMSRSGTALALGSAGGLLNEFWPDVRRRLFHKHQHPAGDDASSNQ